MKNKMFVLILNVLLVSLFSPSVFSQDTVVRIEPLSVTSPDVGDIFSVDIVIENGRNVAGCQVWLTYNPNVLEYADFQKGRFFPDDAFYGKMWFDELSPTETRLRFAVVTSPLSQHKGDGTIITLFFRVLAVNPSFLLYLVEGDLSSGTGTLLSDAAGNLLLPHVDDHGNTRTDATPLIEVFAQDFPYISLEGHSGSVNSVAFSPDGKTLASGSYDNMILLWDAKMNNLLWKRDHSSTVFSVAFSPDGKTLASAGVGGSIYLWNVDTGAHKQTFEGHASLIYSVAFSPDGKTLASGSRDGTIRLWDVLTGKPKHVWDGSEVYSVAFSPDGKTLASGGWLIHLWDMDTGAHIKMLEGHTNWVVSVAFSPDGKTLASGSSDLTVRLWDTNTDELLQTLEGHTDKVSSVAFSPDGKMLASGSWDDLAAEDHIVRLWDTNTGNLLRTLEGHTDGVNSVAFSPDRKTLASGSEDGKVLLWDVSKLFQELLGVDDHGNTRTDATPLSSGVDGALWGAIKPNSDVDYFEVKISDPGELRLYTLFGRDMVFELQDSTGAVLPVDDDIEYGQYEDLRIRHNVSAGTYYVKVTGLSENYNESYRLRANFTPEPDDHGNTWNDATSLSLGESLSGVIETGNDVDYFSVEVLSRGKLTLYTTGDLDTFGKLERNTDNEPTVNDNSGSGLNFRIHHDVIQQTYYVRVTASSNMTGSYTIHASFTPAETTHTEPCHRPMVRVIYYYPSDQNIRDAPSNPLEWVGDSPQATNRDNLPVKLREVQEFFATRMDKHGYGRKTFLYETNTDQNIVVHEIQSSHDDSVLTNWANKDETTLLCEVLKDIKPKWSQRHNEDIDVSKDIYLIIIQMTSSNVTKSAPGVEGQISIKNVNGQQQCVWGGSSKVFKTLGPVNDLHKLGRRENFVSIVAHELGHAFGLPHDFSNGAYLMSYGDCLLRTTDDMGSLSPSTAHWLDVHPAFNKNCGNITNSPTKIKADKFSLKVEVRDTDGIHQIQLIVFKKVNPEWEASNISIPAPWLWFDGTSGLLDCNTEIEDWVLFDYRQLSGAESDEFDLKEMMKDVDPLKIKIRTIDTLGNMTEKELMPTKAGGVEAPGAPIQVSSLPKETILLSNYPNPFNPETWIPYQLANPADVTLTIYDIQGRIVRDLDLGHQRAGMYQSRARAAHWDGRNAQGEPVASGLYFYTFKADEFTATRKMLIRK